MTTRHLERMFHPTSVVLIGARQQPESVAAVVAQNLFATGFPGERFLVTPHHVTIEGVRTSADIASLPTVPDLAVIATPMETVPGVIAALGERGTKAAVVLTTGDREGVDDRSRALQTAMLEAARPHLLRIVGPNGLGIMVPGAKLNASIGHIQPLPGSLAFVAQSGAVVSSVLDWATARRVGFSHLVSLGDMADVDVGDMLDYLTHELHTRAILLCLEAITQARKFMSAARAAARIKPVVVVKVDRCAAGAPAAPFHPAALASADAVYEAAFRRAGILRVNDMQALFDVVETLAMTRPFPGDRLAIVTNSGSMGKLASDALMAQGGRLAQLSPQTSQRLRVLQATTGPQENPVDIGDDAPANRYAEVLEALFSDREVGAMVVLNCPTAFASRTEAAQAVIETVHTQGMQAQTRGLFTCWLGEQTAGASRQALIDKGIATYPTPEEAVHAYMQMVRYRQIQELLMETPPTISEAFTPDTAKARYVVENALAEERSWLAQHEVNAVLAAYGLPVVPTQATLPTMQGPYAYTLRLGMIDDALFGPVLAFGQGGAAGEACRDTALALPPLNMLLARDMMSHTHIYRLLEGHGEILAAAREAIALALVKVSQLICDIAEIVALDIHPLLANNQGVMAFGAGIHVVHATQAASARLAICPYPIALQEELTLPDGTTLLLRPIRPEDEPAYQLLFQQLSLDEIRLRFFRPIKLLSHAMAAYLTQIDYDREMALVLTSAADARAAELYGEVRMSAEPNQERAEFALLIRQDMTGKGLGPLLLRRMIDYARSRGIGELYGEVLSDNRTMLRLCRAFGFTLQAVPGDPGVIRVTLPL
jgi:acyl-CoA synthetase (NDP forming)/RimJ/RimL family protein N-acetyltransferase